MQAEQVGVGFEKLWIVVYLQRKRVCAPSGVGPEDVPSWDCIWIWAGE